MADKKKKIFSSKETHAPKRPVILKSERENTKEQQPKEKLEKEKQPTILLKTREQSAPKDERPQSPKTLEADGLAPSKIAHNDNKDRKTLEQKPSPPLKQMIEPIKLLDENLEFNSAAIEFLHDSSTNYLVVGIIGTQGTGKSMIMNLLAQDRFTSDLCTQILQSQEISTEQNSESQVLPENQLEKFDSPDDIHEKNESSSSSFIFKMQSMDEILKGVHCTKGIDMYITNNRVVLLDCQAFMSPSLIEDPNNPITQKNANITIIECLQVASFLMATCHILIVVQDWFTDYNFLRYIQAAEMLKPTLSASNSVSASQDGSESSGGGESHPHLLILHNRCQLEDYTPDSIRTMQELYKKAFQRSSLQLNSGMYIYSDSNRNGINVDNVGLGYSTETCGTPINLFLLPEIYDDFDNQDIYRGHPPFEKLAKRLRWMILGVNRHQITNVPNLSERGWLQYCIKAWENIRKCTFFMEYERLLP